MNKNTKEDCEMKKEEYLSLIDEVIAQGPYTDTWDSLCEHPTPKWYARDKFGIFIHWGVYSVPAFRSLASLSTGACMRCRLSETNGIPEICM